MSDMKEFYSCAEYSAAVSKIEAATHTIAVLRHHLQQITGDRFSDRNHAALKSRAEKAEAACARYEWLKPRLLAADFEYGDEGDTCCVAIFKWPDNASISADLDASIDAAIANERGEG